MLWSGQNPGNPWTSSVICAVSMNAIDKGFDSVSLGNSFATSSFDKKKKKTATTAISHVKKLNVYTTARERWRGP